MIGLFPSKVADCVDRREAQIFFQQIRSVVLLILLYVWAVAMDRRDTDTHIRIVFMATVVLMDADVGRLMNTLPVMQIEGLHRHDVEAFRRFSLLIPALIHDLITLGRIHCAWLIGLGITAPWVVATSVLSDHPDWLATATRWLGG